jgi:hypothetical protein
MNLITEGHSVNVGKKIAFNGSFAKNAARNGETPD